MIAVACSGLIWYGSRAASRALMVRIADFGTWSPLERFECGPWSLQRRGFQKAVVVERRLGKIR